MHIDMLCLSNIVTRSKLMMIMTFVDGGSLDPNTRYYSIFNAWSPYRYLCKQTNTLQRGICLITRML
jgi:hypothetical protein